MVAVGGRAKETVVTAVETAAAGGEGTAGATTGAPDRADSVDEAAAAAGT